MKSCLFQPGVVVRRCLSYGYVASSRLARLKNPLISFCKLFDETDYELGLLDWRNFATSMVLLPIAPMGVWVGVRLDRRISQVLFYRFLYAGMFLTGVKLLLDAF